MAHKTLTLSYEDHAVAVSAKTTRKVLEIHQRVIPGKVTLVHLNYTIFEGFDEGRVLASHPHPVRSRGHLALLDDSPIPDVHIADHPEPPLMPAVPPIGRHQLHPLGGQT